MEHNDRIYPYGHCSLYRNTPEVSAMYRTLEAEGYKTYEEVFSDESNMLFDEESGMTSIIKLNNVAVFYGRDYADLNYDTVGFRFLNKSNNVCKGGYFAYNKGQLHWTDGTGKIEGFLYVHFHKRKLKIDIERHEKSFIYFHWGLSERHYSMGVLNGEQYRL